MNIEKVKEGLALIDRGMGILGSGPVDYYASRLVECYEFLLTLAPHKVGDRVRLTDTPTINAKESWGWLGDKHFLIKGAVATVFSVEADGNGFFYGVQFDADSWINSYTKVVNPRPPKERHVFNFSARWLEQANAHSAPEQRG